jgi:hypothetical protein
LKYKDLGIDFGKTIDLVAREGEEKWPQPPNPPKAPSTLEIEVNDTLVVGESDQAVATKQEPANREKVPIGASTREEQWGMYLERVNAYPAAAILESWLEFEDELRTYAAKHNISNSQRLPTSRIADELRNRELWDADTFRIFSELRKLRNTVVHTRSGAISPTQAIEYHLTIQRFVRNLREP